MSQNMNHNGVSESNRTLIQSRNMLDLIMYALIPCQSLTLSPYQTRCDVAPSSGVLADTFGAVPTIHDLAVSALPFVRRSHKPNSIGPDSSCVVR